MNAEVRMLLYAMRFSEVAHSGQKRRYTGEPYAEHPRAVMYLVAEHAPGATTDMLCAALLHDTVEDTPVTLGEISQEFGRGVSELVYWLTDMSQPGDGNRKIRKTLDREHIARAPAAAQTIKVADLIHNSESILAHDPGFAIIYMAEKRDTLALLHRADPGLVKIAQGIIDGYYGIRATITHD